MKAKDVLSAAAVAILLVLLAAGYALVTAKLKDIWAGTGEMIPKPLLFALMIGDLIRNNLILIIAGILMLTPMALLVGKSFGSGETDD